MINGYYAIIRRTPEGYYGRFQDLKLKEVYERSYKKIIKKLQMDLSKILLGYFENGIEFPESSDATQIVAGEAEFVTYIEVDIDILAERVQNKFVKKSVTIPKYLNVLGIRNKVNFSQLLTDALSTNLLEWTDNGMRKRREKSKIKIADDIDYTKVDSDEVLSEEVLEFKTWPAMTKHLVIKKRTAQGGIYYIFQFISGKGVMNWGPADYRLAEQQIYIGNIPILMELPEEPGDYTPIPEDYRYE